MEEMDKNIFLTGRIGAGKSTVLRVVLDSLALTYGGFRTLPIISEERKLLGFKIVDIATSKEAKIAFFDENYLIHPVTYGFETVGVEAVRAALINKEAIIMDELGFLESDALNFQKEVFKALESDKLVLGAIKLERNNFLNRVAELSSIIEVTEETKENIPDLLRRLIWDCTKI